MPRMHPTFGSTWAMPTARRSARAGSAPARRPANTSRSSSMIPRCAADPRQPLSVRRRQVCVGAELEPPAQARRAELIACGPLLLLVGVTAFGMPAVAADAQAAPIALHASSDPYAALVAEAAQRFGIPAAWIRAIMHVESRGDRRAVSPRGAMGLMQLMPETWAALRARYGLGRDASIRTTTSWRARLSCARCMTATDLLDSSRRTMPGPADTKIIATAIVRCRPKPSLMLRHLSLLSGTARPMGLSSWRPPIRRPGPRRRFSSCDRQALNLSIARQPNRRRATRRLPSRCATCRPSHRNPMGCSSTFPQRGRSRDRAALPSTCRYIASVNSRFPCRLGGAPTALGGCIAATGRDFAGRRGAACFREEGRAGRGGVQKPTDRGRDKRPQGAARSVGCFYWDILAIRQCAALGRNVRGPATPCRT